MKTRQGFVSNSSSSSFVVAIPKDIILSAEKMSSTVPGDVKDNLFMGMRTLRDVMFGDTEAIESMNYADDSEVLVEQIVKAVISDIEGQSPNDFDAISEELSWEGDGNDDTKAFIESNRGSNVYVFEYGDDYGSFHSTLEHSDIFKNLVHKRISKH